MTKVLEWISGVAVVRDALPGEIEEPGPDPVPVVVSRFQAKAALASAGLLATAEAMVAGADVVTKLAWAEANEFRRDSPTIAALAPALGLSDEQVDALFRTAAGIAA